VGDEKEWRRRKMNSAVALARMNSSPMIIGVPVEHGFVSLKTLFFVTALVASSSTPTQASAVGSMRMDVGSTGLSVLARQQDVDSSLADTLDEIKCRSGLTWGQLAAIFEVSRQTVHSWANGAVVRIAHVARVNELFERVRELGDLPAFKVRDILLGRSAGRSGNQLVQSDESPILVSDNTPFEHQLRLKPGRTKLRRG
jgi:DNA-binding transcriptional regulator YiaG